MSYIINLDIKDRLCVIFGGGRAAYIKASALTKEGGKVRVIAPQICDAIKQLDAQLIYNEYTIDALDGAFIVYALTDNKDLNKKIVSDAKEKTCIIGGIDFTPLAARYGKNISAAVSCGIPSLSVKLAEKILDFDDVCEILIQYRDTLKENNIADIKKELDEVTTDTMLRLAISDISAFEQKIKDKKK